MQKIREILLYEYIGAIAIGFMLAQAISNAVAALVQPVAFYLQTRTSEFLRYGEYPHFSWERLAPSLISPILLFIISFLLIRWLYFAEKPAASESDNTPSQKGITETP